MENSLSALISSSRSVVILLPEKPNFDQVAAGLSLYLSLKSVKDVNISCPAPMVVEFNRLIGVNKITSELGNKNLTISFSGYPAENIDRVSADIDTSEFKLTVIPKNGFASPQKDQVNLSFSGVSADMVILIGGESENNFPLLATPDLAETKLIHIGTRPLTASSERSVMSFVQPASSISELVALTIKENGFALDAEIATNLIAGIEEASDHFMGEDVTADTFAVFSHLLRSGGERIPKKDVNKRTYPPGSIPGQDLITQKVEKKEETLTDEPAPKDWFEPKIYKGTSVS